MQETPVTPHAPDRTRQILIIAVMVLAAATAYFAFQTFSTKVENTQLVENKVELESEINELNTKITTMETEMQRQDIELTEKDRKVAEMAAELELAKKRIGSLQAAGKLTAAQLNEFKFKTDQMGYYIEKYQKQIEELKVENERLTGENRELSRTVQAKDSLVAKVGAEATLYKTKVAAASILKAAEFKFFTVDKKGRDTEAENRETKARRFGNLKTCFTLLENAVAEIGGRTVYVVIKGPDGGVIRPNETEAGYFTHNGQEIPYSAKTGLNYDRTSQQVCITYVKPEALEMAKGNYSITVYCDGYDIGRSTLTVK